ncbi:MAG: metal-dependent hydrolase, partial [Anaerolineae bacterium]
MAQAGIHGMVGMAVRKWTPNQAWLMLGIVLGNISPDADNLAVAVATVAKLPIKGLHRTFTHSLFTVAAVVIAFYVVAWATKRPRWGNLGLGLGIGILMHILLDLLIWFNGVEILWPIPSWVNLWSHVIPPEWWSKLMLPTEFLCFALFFLLLDVTARKRDTDGGFLRTLRVWTVVQGALFVVFTVLVYTMEKGFMTPFGALYLLSLGLAFGVTIRM